MTACCRRPLEQGNRRKRMAQAVSKPNAIDEVVFMIRDRHVEHYIARAREMRRQFLANLLRQAWAGLGKFARRITTKLSVINNPVENILDKAT